MRLERLTPANEDYLEKVYELALISGGPVRSVDIAEELGVSKPSVNKGGSTLKKAGYATDPAYPEKLIKIIEDYELYRYDKVSSATSDGRREALSLPPSPSRLERSSEVEAPLHFKPRSVGSVTIDYTFYERHGVLYIIANGTETYASLARQFNLFRREIMRYNDVKRDGVIPAGQIVYLQAKRNQSTKDLAKHVVAEGETMESISQRFAVKLKNLYKFNNMKPGSEPAPGSIISLRKEKK